MRTLHSAFALSLLALTAACTATTTADAPAGTGPCTGEGALSVGVTGTPADVSARITIAGPGGSRTVTSDTQLKLPAGEYTVTAEAAFDKDPIARKLYAGTVAKASDSVCSESAARAD